MKPEPSFDQIPIRMLQLGVDRQWLAENCDYTRTHINNILAPNGDARAKTNKALRRMWEALDREEEKQALAESGIIEKPPHTMVLSFDDDEYASLEFAALASNLTLREWSHETLIGAAAMDPEIIAREILLTSPDALARASNRQPVANLPCGYNPHERA